MYIKESVLTLAIAREREKKGKERHFKGINIKTKSVEAKI